MNLEIVLKKYYIKIENKINLIQFKLMLQMKK